MPSHQAGRCVEHGLVVAPDGLCVLCRRQAPPPSAADEPGLRQHIAPLQAASTPPGGSSLGVIGVGALLLMAAGGGAWGWRHVHSGAQVAEVAQPSALQAPAEPVLDEQSALDQPKARDLADALQKLERAEAERLEREQKQRAEDAERRGAVEAARKQEEAARDAARHKAVMHDLEQLGLEQARRNVQITMYSTDWCGVCKRARAYMQTRNIPFTELDVERDAAARERAHALNPRGGVPTITIDQELLIGFSSDALEERIARAALKRKQ